jgi:hypothetical protein
MKQSMHGVRKVIGADVVDAVKLRGIELRPQAG